jgi:hypothetical protein
MRGGQPPLDASPEVQFFRRMQHLLIEGNLTGPYDAARGETNLVEEMLSMADFVSDLFYTILKTGYILSSASPLFL